MAFPSLNLSAPSSAEARSGAQGATQGLDAAGGSGNRGFVNNFAAGGSSVAADEINGPAEKRSILGLVAIAAAVVVVFMLWKKYGAR